MTTRRSITVEARKKKETIVTFVDSFVFSFCLANQLACLPPNCRRPLSLSLAIYILLIRVLENKQSSSRSLQTKPYISTEQSLLDSRVSYQFLYTCRSILFDILLSSSSFIIVALIYTITHLLLDPQESIGGHYTFGFAGIISSAHQFHRACCKQQ